MNKPDKFLHVTGQGKPVDDFKDAPKWAKVKVIDEHGTVFFYKSIVECKDDFNGRPVSLICKDGDEYDISQSDADEVSGRLIPVLDWDAAPDKAIAWHIPSVDWLYVRYGTLESSTMTVFEQSYIDENISEFIFRPKAKPVTDEEWDGEVLNLKFAGNAAWEKYKMLFKGEICIIYKSESHIECSGYIDTCEFRPIRTPAQIAEEERKAEIEKMRELLSIKLGFAGGNGYRQYCDVLYDAGYRIAQGEGNDSE